MLDELTRKLLKYPNSYLTDTDCQQLISGTKNGRYSKVKRLVAQGRLLHIRRGLYCLTEHTPHIGTVNPYELAQQIYGPSYISLESALSFHQLIPEAVYTITSVTSRRSQEFHTPLGVFSYQRLPSESFFSGVAICMQNERRFFMAGPWKAICDYVFCYKKDWCGLAPLVGSLRIDLHKLPLLTEIEWADFDQFYGQKRMTTFLLGVRRDLDQNIEITSTVEGIT